MFVEKQVVVNRSIENALQHKDVSCHFRADKSLLKFRVLDKVVKPLLPKARHSTHLKEVRRLHSRLASFMDVFGHHFGAGAWVNRLVYFNMNWLLIHNGGPFWVLRLVHPWRLLIGVHWTCMWHWIFNLIGTFHVAILARLGRGHVVPHRYAPPWSVALCRLLSLHI